MTDALLRDVDDADLEVFYEQPRSLHAVKATRRRRCGGRGFPPAIGTAS